MHPVRAALLNVAFGKRIATLQEVALLPDFAVAVAGTGLNMSGDKARRLKLLLISKCLGTLLEPLKRLSRTGGCRAASTAWHTCSTCSTFSVKQPSLPCAQGSCYSTPTVSSSVCTLGCSRTSQTCQRWATRRVSRAGTRPLSRAGQGASECDAGGSRKTTHVRTSGSAKDLGDMMAHPVPHGRLPRLTPPEAIFLRKSVKMRIFTLFWSKFSRSHPAAAPRFAHSQPGNALLRGAGWLTEPLVRTINVKV
jgi:hypothetical protein